VIPEGKIPLLSYLHDHHYHSHFYGEPFVDENILWYFDGDFLRIVGYDINLEPVSRNQFLKVLGIAENKFEIHRVSFDAPGLIAIKRAYPDFNRYVLDRANSYDGELFVTPDSYRRSSSMSETIRRAHRHGLVCKISQRQPSLSVDQWLLVKNHLDKFEPSPYYRSEYVAALVSLLQHQDSTLFEVYRGEELKCFALVKAVHPHAVFHLLIMSPDRRFLSDLVYHTIIEYFFDLNYRTLSLGAGCNKGIFSYKQKWTTDSGMPGLHEVYWEREGAEDLEGDLWFSRLLSDLN
jgi:hypothetical protein